jgi:protein involved in polysaccharide export with SLBB domain
LGLNNTALKPGDLLRLYVWEENDDDDRAIWAHIRTGK